MANQWKPIKYKEPKVEPQPHEISIYDRHIIQLLTPVIKNRQLIKFWYADTGKNYFEDFRIIEPHTIGQLNTKMANIILTGWFLPTPEQISYGHMEKWGNYILEGISKIEILEHRFKYTRMGYKNPDSRMTITFCTT